MGRQPIHAQYLMNSSRGAPPFSNKYILAEKEKQCIWGFEVGVSIFLEYVIVVPVIILQQRLFHKVWRICLLNMKEIHPESSVKFLLDPFSFSDKIFPETFY